MQRELYEKLMKGIELCARDTAVMFNCTRQYASYQLSKLEKNHKEVKSHYKQETFGPMTTSVKYYFIILKNSP